MASKIVFTGITGLLGGYFLKQKKSGYEIFGLGNKNIQEDPGNFIKTDIRDKKNISDCIKKINPEVIVHAASIGNVDYCERNPDEAYEVNVVGTKNILDVAKEVGAKVVFLSSNAIYEGNNPPYNEEFNLNPVDVYGKTKVEGERLVINSNLDFVILRLMTMYGWPQLNGRANPVTWVIDSLKKGQEINVVSDVYNNHLWAGQAAEVIWEIIEKSIKKGIYNIAGADCISRFELALKVANVFKLDASLIFSVSSDFFKDIAKRPKNTCFNTQKMEKELDIRPLTIDEGLKLMERDK